MGRNPVRYAVAAFLLVSGIAWAWTSGPVVYTDNEADVYNVIAFSSPYPDMVTLISDESFWFRRCWAGGDSDTVSIPLPAGVSFTSAGKLRRIKLYEYSDTVYAIPWYR